MNVWRMGSGLLLYLALGCGGDDNGGNEIEDGGSDLDGGDAGGEVTEGVVTGRGSDGGISDAGRSQLDGGAADSDGSISSGVDGTLERVIAELERAEQLECACLAQSETRGCEVDADADESAKQWENYTNCLRDSVALDPTGSAAALDCLLTASLQYSQCLAELDSCGEDEDPLSSCSELQELAEADCAIPDTVDRAWDACE